MQENIKIKIVNQSGHQLPSYATEGAAGMDLRAYLPGQMKLKPMERFLTPTGIYLQIPEGYEAQVRPRSGLAIKQGITCLNSPGTIDSDYRGEVKVILINLSNEEQLINNGDRIAQLIFARVAKVSFDLVQQLDNTSRGDGGFGHTGRN